MEKIRQRLMNDVSMGKKKVSRQGIMDAFSVYLSRTLDEVDKVLLIILMSLDIFLICVFD